jgi:hypothetical protein
MDKRYQACYNGLEMKGQNRKFRGPEEADGTTLKYTLRNEIKKMSGKKNARRSCSMTISQTSVEYFSSKTSVN